MKAYLVGGAVRDQILNLPVKERDWVVLGETPESMLKQGFIQVGKDFPVFLHPETGEEYALARTERKTSPGYKGFNVHAAPEITLELDLMRRDLTINAIAMSAEGQMIDPYDGRSDIKKRIFRHISPAFSEDPVRILRVARFSARYTHLGFKIADETMRLMQQMTESGETDHLVPERVWTEFAKALTEPTPTAFIQTLKDTGSLARILPELDQLFGVPQPAKYHPEIDTGIHSLMCLEQASRLSKKPEVRFAALVHDLGKAVTPKEDWPHHYKHEKSGLAILENLCHRLRVPNQFKIIAKQVMQYHTHCHRAFELKASTLTDMLTHLGAFKNPKGFKDFLLACEADSRGRTGFECRDYPQADYLWRAANLGAAIDIQPILASGLKGKKIAEAIRKQRIAVINKLVNP